MNNKLGTNYEENIIDSSFGNNVSIEKRDMYGYAVLPSQFEIGKTSRDMLVKCEGEPYDYEIKKYVSNFVRVKNKNKLPL